MRNGGIYKEGGAQGTEAPAVKGSRNGGIYKYLLLSCHTFEAVKGLQNDGVYKSRANSTSATGTVEFTK